MQVGSTSSIPDKKASPSHSSAQGALVQTGERLLERVAMMLTGLLNFMERHREFALSLFVTFVFYFPSLNRASRDAGFLYTGDVLGFYWPSLVKMRALISSGHFTAIDFSLFNGNTEFFLAPNFFGVHPFFVAYSVLSSPFSVSVRTIGRLLVICVALHSFLACYFSLKLLTRFLKLEFWPAAFAAISFAFSFYMMIALTEPEFVFCAAPLPWIVYGALAFEEKRSVSSLLMGALPVLMTFLGGYIPLGIASVALAILLVVSKFLLIEEPIPPLSDRIRTLLVSLAPFGLGSLVVGPYFFAVYTYFRTSPSANVCTLYYSAYHYAELPQTILRILSFRYQIPGPHVEFSVACGLIPLAIVGICLLRKFPFEGLDMREWRIVAICFAIYFLAVLSIFGGYSAVSAMIYYFVPQVGKMHIYQRFLPLVHFFFCWMVALLLRALVQSRPVLQLQIALVGFAGATAAGAFVIGRYPTLALELGIDSYFLFELILAVLFAFALLIPHQKFAYVVTIVLVTLPVLESMYGYSNAAIHQEQRKQNTLVLESGERARFVAYLKSFGNKQLIKYVDLTPMWISLDSGNLRDGPGVETFPKSFPYFAIKEAQLSSYHGFNTYLSTQADYMQRMPLGPDNELRPEWDWVLNTGADFVIAPESELRSRILTDILGHIRNEEVYHLPHDVVAVPLHIGETGGARPPSFLIMAIFECFRMHRIPSPNKCRTSLWARSPGKAAHNSERQVKRWTATPTAPLRPDR